MSYGSLTLAIAGYLDDLHGSTDECARPAPEGEKCLQCREREGVIRRLEEIMKLEAPGAPISLIQTHCP